MNKTVEIESNVVQEVQTEVTYSKTVANLIYLIFGLLETGLIFRLFLKISGASQTSGFVTFIYSVTDLFTRPFEGIFRREMVDGLQVQPVFEPSTFIALIFYAVLAVGIVKLIQILSREKEEITLES